MSALCEGSLVTEFYVRINDEPVQKIFLRVNDSYLAAATALATLEYENYCDPIVEVLDGPLSSFFRYSEGQLVSVVKIS